jgi:mycothiol system anti-sigma-R factor
MKDCGGDYGAIIELYLDKELSGPDREEFRAHLEECEACRAKLEAGEELSRLLHRSRPLYSAPDALRDRVIRTTKLFPSSAPYTPPRLRKLILKVLPRPLQSAGVGLHRWPVLVAAILLVVAGLLPVPGILRRASANSYIEAAVAAHRSSLNGSLPLEIKSESPSAVAAWFAGKVPFNFRLPEAAEAAGHEQVYRLTGGRLVNYKDGYAALVSYQMQQQTISLLVASSKSAVAAGGEEVPSGGIVFHYSKQAGFAVITWSTHGLTYALVSSLPGSGRKSCMVCHQNMANGDHFSARQ